MKASRIVGTGTRLVEAVDLDAGLRAAGQRALGALARRLQPARSKCRVRSFAAGMQQSAQHTV